MSKRPQGLGGNAPDFGKGFSLAFEFAGAVLLFWLIGRFVDNRFDIEPWGQVVGAVIGWVGGFLHVYYKSKGLGWQTVPGTRRPAPKPVEKERSAWGKKRDTGNKAVEVEGDEGRRETDRVEIADGAGSGGGAGNGDGAENGQGAGSGGGATKGDGAENGERESSGVVEAYLAAVARDEAKSRVKGDTQ